MDTTISTASTPLGRPKIALDFVVANALAVPLDAPYNAYIRAFSRDNKLIDTLFRMARRRYVSVSWHLLSSVACVFHVLAFLY
jgi:hypothetical protein